MKETSILCFGDNCVDKYDKPSMRQFAGGNALNTAVHAAMAGCKTAYIGCVGKDPEGYGVLQKLCEKGIDVSHVQSFDIPTAWTQVELAEGERKFVHEYVFPADSFKMTDDEMNYIRDFTVVHNTWQGGTEKYLSDFKNLNVIVSMDFGERYSDAFLNKCINNTDIAFFSTSPAQYNQTEQYGRRMNELGPKLVIVTAGKKGSFAFIKNGQEYYEPAKRIDAIDTLGAGDTYIGTFLAGYVKNHPIPECMKEATEAAAENCKISGGFPDSEITDIIRKKIC